MNALPELVPISELRTRQPEILEALSDKPVLLTQHSRAAAVLLSPELYNKMVEYIEDLEDSVDAFVARRDAEPMIALDAYLAERGGAYAESASEQPRKKGSRPPTAEPA